MGVFATTTGFTGDSPRDTGATGMTVVDPGLPLSEWNDATLRDVWRTQPALRKVLGFKARALASITLHLYERAEKGRDRVRTGEVADMLRSPSGNPAVTPFAFWEGWFLDRWIYDRAAAAKIYGKDGSLRLVRIPARRWSLRSDSLDLPTEVRVHHRSGGHTDLPLDRFVLDTGYSEHGANGTSPILTLRTLLEELQSATENRRNLHDRGARLSGVVTRDRPWSSDEARTRFHHAWQAFSRGGAREGGTALLEDGMSYQALDTMTPRDLLDIEGRKLSDEQVASFFGVPPEMVGIRAGNYSNMDAFRQMLYQSTLGPDIVAWEQAVNLGLDDFLPADQYIEANVEGKLRGSFTEQAQILQSSVGGPYMTRAEARSRQNLPPLPADSGADELITPLNVVAGGQASPQDATPPSRGAAAAHDVPTKFAARPLVKERADEEHEDEHAKVFARHFRRQAAAVLSRLGAGEDWWDAERWDDELAADLASAHLATATAAAHQLLQGAGLDPDTYDEARTVAFLTEAARRSAQSINATTHDHVAEALADPEVDDAEGVAAVFEDAEENRAVEAAVSAVTFVSGFGVVEAARQQDVGATKTWVVTSGNPRASHAAMDGETVPLDQDFSNGLPWPGAAGSDVDEVAGCRCEVLINLPD